MKFMTFRQLQEKLGNRSRSTIYRDLEEGRLPKPRKLGGRLYWVEDEIDKLMVEAGDDAQ